jgi:hypothetical protein
LLAKKRADAAELPVEVSADRAASQMVAASPRTRACHQREIMRGIFSFLFALFRRLPPEHPTVAKSKHRRHSLGASNTTFLQSGRMARKKLTQSTKKDSGPVAD